jgi:uncharacterized protein involved in exopolysaccharide biosynthesis
MKSEYIDLGQVVKLLLKDKKLVITVIFSFTILGVIYSLLVPIKYETEIILKPESPNISNTNASSLLSQFGINTGLNFGQNNTYLDPFFFEYIINSYDFKNHILNTKLSFSNLNEKITYQEYYQSREGINLFEFAKSFIKNLSASKGGEYDQTLDIPEGTVTFTNDEKLISRTLEENIIVDYDQIRNILEIRTSMPDRFCVADLAIAVSNYLTEYSKDYATKKSMEDHEFIKKQYDELKEKYYTAQGELATYKVRNINIQSEYAKIEEKRLENEYTIAYELYLNAAKQLETSKVTLQQSTPVFSILVEPEVPLWRTQPKRKILVAIFFTCGFFLSVFISIYKNRNKIF